MRRLLLFVGITIVFVAVPVVACEKCVGPTEQTPAGSGPFGYYNCYTIDSGEWSYCAGGDSDCFKGNPENSCPTATMNCTELPSGAVICEYETFEPRGLSIAIGSVEEITPIGNDDYVVTSLIHPTATAVTRVRFGAEEPVASTPALSPYSTSPTVFAAERGWWFNRFGNEELASSVFFVVSDGAMRQNRVSLPWRHRRVWLPIRGNEARGVYVSVDEKQHALLVAEVTPAGVKPLGAFPWQKPIEWHGALWNSRWSAEPLSGDRVAIVETDHLKGESTLTLRIAGGASEPVESPLPCPVAIDSLDTAVDGSDRIAVVGLSKKREVVAMVFDADRPRWARCQNMTPPGEVGTAQHDGTPSVVWTGDAFVAAWIRGDGNVRACELRDDGVPPLVVNIGEGADVERSLRQLAYSDGDTVMFIWRERYGGFVERRMPKNVTGYSVAVDAARLVCRWLLYARDSAARISFNASPNSR